MAGGFDFEMKGIEKLRVNFKRIAQQFGDAVGLALRAEGELEMTEAKRRTPVDTGTLRASGLVDGPIRLGFRADDIVVTMTFGGPAAPYALLVHEDEEAFHHVGQAKFLESTLRESAPHMAKRVADRIRRETGA